MAELPPWEARPNRTQYPVAGAPGPVQASYPAPPGPMPFATPGMPPGPYPPYGPSAYPPRRKTGTLKVLLIIGACMFVGLAGLVGLGLLMNTSTETRPLTSAERAKLFTIDDLSEWIPEYQVNRALEKSSYDKTLSGSYELSYDYEHNDELYITCTLTVEKNTSDAKAGYTGGKIGGGIGTSMAGDGFREETHDDLFRWGDESHFITIIGPNGPVGNRLLARKGARVIFIQISGVYFSTSEDIHELLDGPLARAMQ
ncbi:MAG: hypothetical protein IPP14_07535 [Planctomycetes bacterium]|nr:hypothetical protein [Planctomycetota bacterium]